MIVRLPKLALVVAMAALAGCSGGTGGPPTVNAACDDPASRVLCLQSCSLGCTSTGCGRTDIAVNEVIQLTFSEAVDTASVTPSSIRLRTAAGAPPVGQFFVRDNLVEFIPTLSSAGGQSFFGFTPGETYTLTLPGGDGLEVVRSTSGKPFERTLTCTLQATRGIVDQNGVPPSAILLTPTALQLENAPRDTLVVLEFNELVDEAAFGGGQSPISVTVRRTRAAIGGGVECDPESTPQPVPGGGAISYDAGRGRSTWIFQPTQPFPGNVCVNVNVTNGVRDLAGNSAQPQQFAFRTIPAALIEDNRTENFDTAQFLDADASSAQWAGGSAVFRQIGSDGRHGAFSLALAVDTLTTTGPPENKQIFVLNGDNTIIPPANTTTGAPILINDGRFFFTSMVVPANVRLRITGANPPVITVAGKLEILGEIDVNGGSITAVPVAGATPTTPATGQPGATGGPFAGSGGRGGDKITSTGSAALHNGVNGSDARVPTGHAYASSVVNTGGRGSVFFPTSGSANDFLYGGTNVATAANIAAAAGGGGGGFVAAGGLGRVVSNNHAEAGLGVLPVTAGSTATTLSGPMNTFLDNTTGLLSPRYPWVAGRYVGRTIQLLTSTGVLIEARTIVSHTLGGVAGPAVFTVTPAWTTVPATTNQFRVLGDAATATPLVAALGPSAAGGNPLQLFPVPPNVRSSDHFLAGGSGGGGGGSMGTFAIQQLLSRTWIQGSGGGGGGGALALRAGSAFTLGAAARILARGGSAAANVSTVMAVFGVNAAPGGGGSGGGVVLQAGGDVSLAGLVDVRGGAGGDFDRFSGPLPGQPPAGARIVIEGGDGANGFIRAEATGTPTLALLPNAQPPATADNVAILAETDALAMCRSKIYSTELAFGPEYVRYEIYAVVDGTPTVYSDDPAISPLAALGEASAIRALFQCARIDLTTQEVLQLTPWRLGVRSAVGQTGIASDALNAFRFQLTINRAIATNVTIDRVVVVYRR
jgi:hypothetical protein